jgi:NADPH:quinone reductase-like Zn-dependent oxidoreductase
VAVRLGLYEAAKGAYPICPGLEFAGVVRRTGSQVYRFRSGDRVLGASRFGAYATVINSPVEHLWPLPDTWDFTRGAAFPVVYLTAYYGLHHVGNLRKSDEVLVHSAAGGVGTALLHLLKINGNMSVGVVGRSRKAAAATEAGASFVIDKASQKLWREAEKISTEGFDMILDANGASTLRGSYRHLKPAGRLLIYGFTSMFARSGRKNWPKLIWYYLNTPRFSPYDLTGNNKTISGFNLIYLFDKVDLFHQALATLFEWETKGLIPAMPLAAFSFKEVAKAHRAIESGESIGKLVLSV